MHTTRAIAHQLGAVRHLQGYPLLGYMMLVVTARWQGLIYNSTVTGTDKRSWLPSHPHNLLILARSLVTRIWSIRAPIRVRDHHRTDWPDWFRFRNRIPRRWSPTNRCQCHSLTQNRASALDWKARHGDLPIRWSRIGSAGSRSWYTLGRYGFAFDQSSSDNKRRQWSTSKMIHAGPTRSTRDREIWARSRSWHV